MHKTLTALVATPLAAALIFATEPVKAHHSFAAV